MRKSKGMKTINVLFAVIAIVLGSSRTFGGASRWNPPAGYSLYTYLGGNPTSAISYSWVSSEDASLCNFNSGIACVVEGLTNGGKGHNPKQQDINKLKTATGGCMCMPAHASTDSNVWLRVDAE